MPTPIATPPITLRGYRRGVGLSEDDLARMLRRRPHNLSQITAADVRCYEAGVPIPEHVAATIAIAFRAPEFVRCVQLEFYSGSPPHCGALLRYSRLWKGFSQAQIALVLGLKNANFVSMVESGTSKLPIEHAAALDDLFGFRSRILTDRAAREHLPPSGVALLA